MPRIVISLLSLLSVFHASSAFDDLVPIGSGFFYMGQEDIQDDESPIHSPNLEEFEIDRFEITIGEWNLIADWAILNGYDFSEDSNFPWGRPYWYTLHQNDRFPMNKANWYDAVKWCNARSEYMGRLPCYFLDANKTIVYRSGEIDLNASNVSWNGSGYRLPTEEQWEKAARGGLYGKNYPWGNQINGSQANYKASGDPFDDGVAPVGYYDGNQSIEEADYSMSGETAKPLDQSNAYGLHDMVGNVGEWCWDWYDKNWYSQKSSGINSYGPLITTLPFDQRYKVFRGGGYKDSPGMEEGKPLRIAFRHVEFPHKSKRSIGFRCVRSTEEEDLWITESEVGQPFLNWYYLNWFGHYYRHAPSNWIFHPHFGWVFPTGNGSYNNWIYFPECGWMWTARFVFPFFYNEDRSQWFMYLSGGEPGWFQSIESDEYHRWGGQNN